MVFFALANTLWNEIMKKKCNEKKKQTMQDFTCHHYIYHSED